MPTLQKISSLCFIALSLASLSAHASSQKLKSFTLINADTDQPLQGYESITSNKTIDLSMLPTRNLSIRANTSPSRVGSVKFKFDGKSITENQLPYALFGDDDNGKDYVAWKATLGKHKLSATVYSKSKAKGSKGASLSIELQFVEAAPTPPASVEPEVPMPPAETPEEVSEEIPSGAIFVSAGAKLQSAIDSLSSGDTLVLRDGEYAGDIKISKSNVTLRAEHFRKAVIKAPDKKNLLVTGDHVTLKGLVFRGGGESGKNSAQNDYSANRIERDTKGTVLQDCVFEDTKGVGLSLDGDDIVATRLVARNNGAAGIGGSHGSNILLSHSYIYHNNHVEHKSDGGGGKFTRSDRVVIEFVESWDNVGPGIWFDVWNTNATVRNSYVHNNKGTSNIHGKGIMYELLGGDKSGKVWGMSFITNNKVANNDEVSGRAKDQQRGILISSSARVAIENNTVINDTINLKDGDREIKTDDISIEDNRLENTDIVFSGASHSCCTMVNNNENAPGATEAVGPQNFPLPQ